MKKKIILTLFLVAGVSIILFLKVDLISKNLELKKIIAKFNQKISALALDTLPYSPYFIPQYPQRLKYLVSEMTETNESLALLNKELESVMAGGGIFADPNSQREEISQIRQEIQSKSDYLSLWQGILDAEISGGLDRELETLRPEVAIELKTNLEKFRDNNNNLISTTQNNLSLASSPTQYGISSQPLVLPTQACIKGMSGKSEPIVLNFKLGVTLDDLKLGHVTISNLKLGLPDEIELSTLPDLSSIPIQFPDVTITFPEIPVAEIGSNSTIDLSSRQITAKSPQLSFPKLPEISFSCPQFPSLSVPFSTSTVASSTESIETKWYFKTLEWLSNDICQNLPGVKNKDYGYPATTTFCLDEEGNPIEKPEGCALFGECFDPKRVPLVIYHKCNQLWSAYFDLYFTYSGFGWRYTECKDGKTESCYELGKSCVDYLKKASKYLIDTKYEFVKNTDICSEYTGYRAGIYTSPPYGMEPQLPPSICQSIGAPDSYQSQIKDFGIGNRVATTTRALASSCADLFIQERKPVPQSCSSDMASSTIITTIETECDAIKENIKATKGELNEVPSPCKLLALFSQKIGEPESEDWVGGTQGSSGGKMGDYPPSMLGCEPPPFPTIPKIKLPSIAIPDIHLPDINLLIVNINLPDLITEDLVFPEIDICNLDDCKNFYNGFANLLKSPLKLSLPSLNIPSIEIPAVSLPELTIFVEGYGNVRVISPEVKIGSLKFPPVFFKMPQLPQFSLGSLAMPEVKVEPISLPQPQFFFAFEGIDIKIDPLSFILGLLGIPEFNYCLPLQFPALFLNIGFPDYVFSWPAFPEIPQNFFCKDISGFCGEMAKSLDKVDINSKIKGIEDKINTVFQDKIQSQLNQINPLVKDEITTKINEKLNDQINRVRGKLEEYQNNTTGKVDENGILKIPPIVIPGETIEIPGVSLSNLAAGKIPSKIPIPWPDTMKKLNLMQDLTYDLGRIPLSNLSYTKEIPIPLPGFHTFDISADFGGEQTISLPSLSAANLFQMGQVQSNVITIEDLVQQASQASQKIIDILE